MTKKAQYVFEKYAGDPQESQEDITKNLKNYGVGLGFGALAGAISTAVVQPIDQTVNIMATHKGKKNWAARTKSYKDIIKAVYHGDISEKAKATGEYTKGLKGLKNFYSGLGGKLIKTAPQSAILLGLNAALYSLYKKKKKESEDSGNLPTN